MPTLVLAALVLSWLDATVAARLHDAWPDITEASHVTGTDPYTLLVVESGMTHIMGGHMDRMVGAGQVHYYFWRAQFAEEGIAERAEDLLEPRQGIMGAAVALETLRRQYGPGSVWHRGGECILCTYNAGMAGLKMRDGCNYSRRVLGIRSVLRRTHGARW